MIAPVKNFNWKTNTSQLFGVDKARYQAAIGSPGHPGIDIIVPPNSLGQEVFAAHDGQVTTVAHNQWDVGNAIYIQGHDKVYLDTAYMHLSEILVNSGQAVKAGDLIGKIGSTGYSTGPHLHFAVRKIKILPGSWTEIIQNDYKGNVDPVPFLFRMGDKLPIKFTRNLYYGIKGDDVSWLQTCLKLEEFAGDYEPIGEFGLKTLRDVRKLQSKYKILSTGFAGPVTRDFLNVKYT